MSDETGSGSRGFFVYFTLRRALVSVSLFLYCLVLFLAFDFVYSSLVLQHMKPEYSQNYIKEFLRILAPGGLVYFQLPAEQEKPAALDPARRFARSP